MINFEQYAPIAQLNILKRMVIEGLETGGETYQKEHKLNLLEAIKIVQDTILEYTEVLHANK